MSSEEEQLSQIRDEIDRIDSELHRLLNDRARMAQKVAEIKLQSSGEVQFYRAEREAQVLRAIKERNQGPLSDEEVARLFREIMSACLALEQPMTIAFLGPEGTFTQAAALKQFGHSVNTRPMGAIDEVFREVESGSAHYGVVPVENSTEGVVNHTLDQLISSSLNICGEVAIRIHHHLMGKGEEPAAIQRIYSHQQTLAQCREWLNRHYPNVERIEISSNAEAARRVAEEAGSAAIAGEIAAELYGLTIWHPNIEDNPDNTTRFLVIGNQQVAASGDDKTTLLLSTKNQPGALHSLLEPLARNDITMSRIESRPSRRGMWDYVFFVDIEGHKDDELVANALHELEKDVTLFKVLGSYPRAVL
jgi:chorismate mutase/prephenate dehydratase